MHRSRPLLSALILLILAVPAHGEGERVLLGADGQPVRLLQDTYGDLFPLGSETAPRNSVLALDRHQADGTVVRELVPGTEGPGVEREAQLLFDGGAETLFVLWENREADSSALRLVGLDHEGVWSAPIQVSGELAGWTAPPRLRTTRDTAAAQDPDEESGTDLRTVFHLLWSGEDGGQTRFSYSPLVLHDGIYIGTHPVYDLHELAGAETAVDAPDPAAALVGAATVAAGRDDQTVVFAFADPVSRRLVTLELRVLSRELASLADGARSHITIVGSRSRDLVSIADAARSHITIVGHRFHPAVITFMGDRVYQTIAAAAGNPSSPTIEELADLARQEILDVGAAIEDQGLLGVGTAGDSAILEFGSRDTQLLRLRRVTQLPVPETPEAPTRIFVSPDGQRVLVSWVGDGMIEYRQARGEGWSEVHRIELGAGLDLAAAFELLERRVGAAD